MAAHRAPFNEHQRELFAECQDILAENPDGRYDPDEAAKLLDMLAIHNEHEEE